jgi:hypothetical protein
VGPNLGIVDSLGLVGSLVFAVPLGIAGIEFLLAGRTAIGVTLVVVAVLMVVVPLRVDTPADLPGLVASRLVGRAVIDPDEAAERDGDQGAERSGGSADGGDGRRE